MYAEPTSQKPLWPHDVEKSCLLPHTKGDCQPSVAGYLQSSVAPLSSNFSVHPQKDKRDSPQQNFVARRVGPLSGDGSLGVSLDALFLPQVLEVN